MLREARRRARHVAQRIVQTWRVARTVDPAPRFVLDVLTGHAPRTFRARRTGFSVTLRPRADLQVARESLSKEGYPPPPEARALLDAHAPVRILDAGANIGLWTLSALRTYGKDATVVAVEPDPTNLPLLRENIERNGLTRAVEVHPVAAGSGTGSVRFKTGERHMSHIAGEQERGPGVAEVPLADFFELARGCHLVKLDIEGGEWPILHDPRLAELDAAAIVLEWHARGSQGPDPKAEAIGLLQAAGYTVRPDPDYPSSTVGGLWAWRRAPVP
jgi:FkbM family methyltransferase